MFRRQTELFGLRWAIIARSWADSIWKNRLFGCLILFGFSCLYCYWTWHVPTPGKAVAALAVVAAVMTFRSELGGLEKFFWMLVLFAFLFIELKAIDRDRADYAREQAERRQKEAENFQHIGAGIQTSIDEGRVAIDGLKETLEATKQTVSNTEPKARLTVQRIHIYKGLPLAVGSRLEFNVYYINNGNETAVDTVHGGRIYIGKKDDAATQKVLANRFDKWWRSENHSGSSNLADHPESESFFSLAADPLEEADLKQLLDRTGTIYIFLRFQYSDHAGRWATDWCSGYQDVLQDFAVAHPCLMHKNQRYAVKLR